MGAYFATWSIIDVTSDSTRVTIDPVKTVLGGVLSAKCSVVFDALIDTTIEVSIKSAKLHTKSQPSVNPDI